MFYLIQYSAIYLSFYKNVTGRYLNDIYFKNLSLFTVDALHMQLTALQALELDDAFHGKEHKNRRKTIRNQMDKINEELGQRIRSEHDTVSLRDSGSPSDSDTNGKIVGGIWGL